MRFPHAAKGVKKIFIAELLMLVSGLAALVMIVLAVMSDQNASFEKTAATGVLICGVTAGLLMLFGGIMMVIGYIQTAKDEESFVKAIIFAVVSVVLAVAASYFQGRTGAYEWVYTIISAVAQLTWMIVAISAIGGLIDLSYSCNRADLVRRGGTILKLLDAIYILTFILIILKQVFKLFLDKAVINSITAVIEVVVSVLSLIQYILYLSYLGKVSGMLKES